MPRYVRYHHTSAAEALSELRAQYGGQVAPVSWIDHFYSLPAEVLDHASISHTHPVTPIQLQLVAQPRKVQSHKVQSAD